MQIHIRYMHGKTAQDPRESRVRHSDMLQEGQLLCIMRRCETSSEDADWLEEDEVDASGLTILELPSSSLQMPVMKESEWLANQWKEEQ